MNGRFPTRRCRRARRRGTRLTTRIRILHCTWDALDVLCSDDRSFLLVRIICSACFPSSSPPSPCPRATSDMLQYIYCMNIIPSIRTHPPADARADGVQTDARRVDGEADGQEHGVKGSAPAGASVGLGGERKSHARDWVGEMRPKDPGGGGVAGGPGAARGRTINWHSSSLPSPLLLSPSVSTPFPNADPTTPAESQNTPRTPCSPSSQPARAC